MANRGSANYGIVKLGGLIEDYINNEDSSAKPRLAKMNIKGEDLTAALDNLNLTVVERRKYEMLKSNYGGLEKNYQEICEDYKELKENNEKLINALELITRDLFIDKIKGLLELLKEIKK